MLHNSCTIMHQHCTHVFAGDIKLNKATPLPRLHSQCVLCSPEDKKLTRGGVYVRHWSTELRKHVFPKLARPAPICRGLHHCSFRDWWSNKTSLGLGMPSCSLPSPLGLIRSKSQSMAASLTGVASLGPFSGLYRRLSFLRWESESEPRTNSTFWLNKNWHDAPSSSLMSSPSSLAFVCPAVINREASLASIVVWRWCLHFAMRHVVKRWISHRSRYAFPFSLHY